MLIVIIGQSSLAQTSMQTLNQSKKTNTLFGIYNSKSKLKIEINKNIELLGFGYFIGFEGRNIEKDSVTVEGKIMPKKDWHQFGYTFYKEYKNYSNSENAIKSFTVADHLWLDYLTSFLLELEDIPNARITDSINPKLYLNFSKTKNLKEARQNAEIFLEGLNALAKEVDFDTFLKKFEPYYDLAIKEVGKALVDPIYLDAMEAHHKKEFDNYILIPSLTIPKGMGFGINHGEGKVWSVFGALDFQEINPIGELSKMGFLSKEKLREKSMHEFGHTFVNPEVYKLSDSLLAKTAHLFTELEPAMNDQGYNTWKVCLYEHFTRAGEIFITNKIGLLEEAKELQANYENIRKFKYIPEILVELKKYDQGFYSSYFETIENTMVKLAAITEKE